MSRLKIKVSSRVFSPWELTKHNEANGITPAIEDGMVSEFILLRSDLYQGANVLQVRYRGTDYTHSSSTYPRIRRSYLFDSGLFAGEGFHLFMDKAAADLSKTDGWATNEYAWIQNATGILNAPNASSAIIKYDSAVSAWVFVRACVPTPVVTTPVNNVITNNVWMFDKTHMNNLLARLFGEGLDIYWATTPTAPPRGNGSQPWATYRIKYANQALTRMEWNTLYVHEAHTYNSIAALSPVYNLTLFSIHGVAATTANANEVTRYAMARSPFLNYDFIVAKSFADLVNLPAEAKDKLVLTLDTTGYAGTQGAANMTWFYVHMDGTVEYVSTSATPSRPNYVANAATAYGPTNENFRFETSGTYSNEFLVAITSSFLDLDNYLRTKLGTDVASLSGVEAEQKVNFIDIRTDPRAVARWTAPYVSGTTLYQMGLHDMMFIYGPDSVVGTSGALDYPTLTYGTAVAVSAESRSFYSELYQQGHYKAFVMTTNLSNLENRTDVWSHGAVISVNSTTGQFEADLYTNVNNTPKFLSRYIPAPTLTATFVNPAILTRSVTTAYPGLLLPYQWVTYMTAEIIRLAISDYNYKHVPQNPALIPAKTPKISKFVTKVLDTVEPRALWGAARTVRIRPMPADDDTLNWVLYSATNHYSAVEYNQSIVDFLYDPFWADRECMVAFDIVSRDQIAEADRDKLTLVISATADTCPELNKLGVSGDYSVFYQWDTFTNKYELLQYTSRPVTPIQPWTAHNEFGSFWEPRYNEIYTIFTYFPTRNGTKAADIKTPYEEISI